jgi:hypothetical protein
MHMVEDSDQLEPASELDGERFQEQGEQSAVKNALLLTNYLTIYLHTSLDMPKGQGASKGLGGRTSKMSSNAEAAESLEPLHREYHGR